MPGWWEDDEGETVELIVSAPDGTLEAEVQIAYFYYAEDEVVPGLGPVLSLYDIGGWKTTTVANRMGERDYVDYALLRRWYSRQRLFDLAAPTLTGKPRSCSTASWVPFVNGTHDVNLGYGSAPRRQVRTAV